MRRLCFVFLTCSLVIYGQNSKNTIQNWFDFDGSYSLNAQWKVYGDAGYRVILGDETSHRFYIRPTGFLQLNNILTLHAGIAYFITYNNANTLKELRPFQGIAINWPKISSTPFTHYIRFEERLFSSSNSSSLIYRWRYQLGIRIRVDENKEEKYFYIPLQLEWFANYNRDFSLKFNEFRAVFGTGFVFNNLLRFEFNAIFQNPNAHLEKIYTFNDIIFRFRIYKEFNTDI